MVGIGSKIKEARLKRGLTQEQLANIIGVRQTAIGNYENDISHPREEILVRLFKALKVDANYLFEGQFNTTNKEYFTQDETSLISTYRELSAIGKSDVRNFVAYTLTKEQQSIAEETRAAHNDAPITDEEIALMNQDIDEL